MINDAFAGLYGLDHVRNAVDHDVRGVLDDVEFSSRIQVERHGRSHRDTRAIRPEDPAYERSFMPRGPYMVYVAPPNGYAVADHAHVKCTVGLGVYRPDATAANE